MSSIDPIYEMGIISVSLPLFIYLFILFIHSLFIVDRFTIEHIHT